MILDGLIYADSMTRDDWEFLRAKDARNKGGTMDREAGARVPCTPIAPECSGRCGLPAALWIMGPDGLPVPGATVCVECGVRTIREYREKLGETWTLAALNPGRRCEHGLFEQWSDCKECTR